MPDTEPTDQQYELDPVFLHSRRELWIIFGLWAVGLLWAVPFCYITGYLHGRNPSEFTTILGMPAWLFWGIAVPWVVADIFTTWFCFCYMKNDDLGEAHEGADIEEDLAELHREEGEAGP